MTVKTTFRGGNGAPLYPVQQAKQMNDIRPSADQLSMLQGEHPDTSTDRYQWNKAGVRTGSPD